MSANRLRTSCACGFWDFSAADPAVAERRPDDPALLAFERYCAEIGVSCAGGRGYGFREDLSGSRFPWWRSPDGQSSSGTPKEGWIEDPFLYEEVHQEDRYRWARLDCPACRRAYVGWYRRVPGCRSARGQVAEPAYELYDTSFWHSFSDDPGARDLEGVIAWTPALVAEALSSFAARSGGVGEGR